MNINYTSCADTLLNDAVEPIGIPTRRTSVTEEAEVGVILGKVGVIEVNVFDVIDTAPSAEYTYVFVVSLYPVFGTDV
jgi:hypothetical protein